MIAPRRTRRPLATIAGAVLLVGALPSAAERPKVAVLEFTAKSGIDQRGAAGVRPSRLTLLAARLATLHDPGDRQHLGPKNVKWKGLTPGYTEVPGTWTEPTGRCCGR